VVSVEMFLINSLFLGRLAGAAGPAIMSGLASGLSTGVASGNPLTGIVSGAISGGSTLFSRMSANNNDGF